jgi:hypothetical protein
MARRNGVTYFTGNSHKVTEQKKYAEEGYTTIESRIESRFTDFQTGEHRGLMICIGQAKSKGGFMMTKYNEFQSSPDAVTVRMTIWESFGWHNYTTDKGDIKRGVETAPRDSFYYDMRKRTLMSKEAAALVMNGRAAAPPGIDCRMGVSTSRYPRELKYSRMEVYTLFRLMNISFTPSFTTKST